MVDHRRFLLAALVAGGAALAGCEPSGDTSPDVAKPPPEFPLDPCENSQAGRESRLPPYCHYEPGSTCSPVQNVGDLRAVQYVFILMLENRSFDSYYGRFPAYLRDVLGHRAPGDEGTGPEDIRLAKYLGQGAAEGVDVPGTPRELRPACEQADQDKVLDGSYDPRVDAPFNPLRPGADPASAAEKVYWRHAQGPLEQCVSDTCHEWWCSHLEWNSGRMDGFVAGNEQFFEGGEPRVPPDRLKGERAMLYYDQREIPFYYWLADQFAMGDHYYASMLGPTWPNRDYLYGATSRGLTSNSSNDYDTQTGYAIYAGDQAPNPAAQEWNGKTLDTLYDALEAGGVGYSHWVRQRYGVRLAKWGTWFGGVHSTFPVQATTFDYDAGVVAPGFESYVQAENAALATGGSTGSLYPVNFIDPDYLEDVNGEDEHPPGLPQMGQRLVYDVVRILLSNPEVWKRSVLFVTYDEGGGFYDHVDPPEACAPDDIAPQWTGPYGNGGKGDKVDAEYRGRFDRYGFRVPLLVVSPFAKKRYVSHRTYDHTSIVRFVEARFGLPALTRRDANADPLLDFFDFDHPSAGNETLPAAFPVGPGGTTVTADSVRWFGAQPGEMLALQSHPECIALMPPSTGHVPNVLGEDVFGPREWSRGVSPPDGYDPGASRPFPTMTANRPPSECVAQPGTLRVKVITTYSEDPNEPIADPLYNVHVKVGGVDIVVPEDDNHGRGVVGPGPQLVKFPKDNGLDDADTGEHLYRVGSIVVSSNLAQHFCRPTSQEGDVTYTLDTVAYRPESQSDYEVGIRIVPFDAPEYEGGVVCQ